MNQNENEQKEIQITFETPGTGKILSAHLFDWFISVVLGFILLIGTFIVVPNLPHYQSALKERNEILLSSSLYIEKEEKIVPLLNAIDADTSLTVNQKSEKINESLCFFFENYVNLELDNKGKETYLGFKKEAKKEDKPLFDEDGNRLYPNPDYDRDYYDFYSSTFSKKALGYLSLKKGYSSSRHTILWTIVISVALTFFFSFLVFYLVFPLIFSRGKRTLGMMLMKTSLVGKDGFSCSLSRFLLHSAFEIIFIIIGSLFAFLIPLGISITMIIVRQKDHQSLTDYVIGTYVVSSSQKKIYLNIYEYLEGEHKANSSHIIEDNSIKFS